LLIWTTRRKRAKLDLMEMMPIPLRPPGYFDDCYGFEEIQLENRLVEASAVEKPVGLE